MAVKRIVKFILKLAVAGGILVGAYFGITALFGKNNKVNLIADTARETGVSQKLTSSTSELLSKVSDSNYALKVRISAMDDINSVLVEYFDYYTNISQFENKHNDSKKAEIVKSINDVNKIVDQTIEYMRLVNSATNDEIKNQRVVITAKHYTEQIKAMIELDELLKSYVYEVNYDLVSTGIVKEAQLEMMKDYSKAVFYDSIYQKIETTDSISILTSNQETSFTRTYTKFKNKQALNVNGDRETHFAWFYMYMDKAELNEFYKLDKDQKQTYKNTRDTETKRMYFDSLYNYLMENSF